MMMRVPVTAAIGISVATAACCAQVDPVSGIDFVTITAPGNAPWPGGFDDDRARGRGRVDYDYRIGRYEVNTTQWVEFFNAAFDRPANDQFFPNLFPPDFWSAVGAAPTVPGGQRWRVPAGAEMNAVGSISWRTAAMYCNWLHNDKALNREAFLSGAYDVSTFGYVGNTGEFTDQFVRSPGAKYFIPSWDEWLKAVHYDPAKVNSDGSVGGWWEYGNGTNQPFVGGAPGTLVNGQLATANFGFLDGPVSPFSVPLGAYGTTNPWGLYDVAGGTSEWTEEVIFSTGLPYDRVFEGTAWVTGSGTSIADSITRRGGGSPPSSFGYLFGFRVAAVVPGPGTLICVAIGVMPFASRRRRLT